MQISSSRLRAAVSRSGRRRLASVAVAGTTLLAAAGTAAMAFSAPAGAAGSSSGSSSSTSVPCSASSAPSGEIAFSGTLSNGSGNLGSNAKLTGLSGSLCGAMNLATMSGTVQPADFELSPSTTTVLGLLSMPTTETVTAPATATLSMGSTSGTYNTSMQVSIDATASVLGLFKCQIGPFSPTFTTGKSGSVTGTPLTGSLLTQLSGTLVAGDFSVPAIKASSSCPSIIAGLANMMVGLPLAAGKSTITTSVSIAPVLPAS